MKTPPEYLAATWQPEPDPWPAGGVPFVPVAQAEAAITAALADAEKYHRLLASAIRNATSPTPCPAPLPPSC